MPLVEPSSPSTDSDEDDRDRGGCAAPLQTITEQAAVEKPLLELAVINKDARSQRPASQLLQVHVTRYHPVYTRHDDRSRSLSQPVPPTSNLIPTLSSSTVCYKMRFVGLVNFL
jgi:hypothetical protein